MKHLLPAESLVPFDAWRARQASTVWVRPETNITLGEYAYFIPLAGDHGGAWQGDGGGVRTFFAERYGGDGLVFNGGGARCGLLDAVQIKGIGRNCLAGSATGFWHSYGGESVANGVREVIWSELLQAALPFGAVPVHGVLDTGTRAPAFALNGEEGSVPRGLTIREAALRPAHFMRAVYFSRADIRSHGLAPDNVRTAAAIGMLESALRHHRLAETVIGVEYLAAALRQLFERYGAQSAAALAKRIVHGTLNASNLSIDGRWIDFGTISTISDYGRIATAQSGEDVWDHGRVAKVAVDWMYYLKRFLPATCAMAVPSGSTLFQIFLDAYEARLEIEFLKLTGLPETLLMLVSPHHRSALYGCLRRIAGSGNQTSFKLFQPCLAGTVAMPDRMGHYHLNTILGQAALTGDAAATDEALRQTLDDDELRTAFVDAYWLLRSACRAAMRVPQEPHHFTLFVAINALRVNRGLPRLYRHILDAEIAERVAREDDLQRYADEMIAQGKMLLAEPCAGRICLDGWVARSDAGSLMLSPERGGQLQHSYLSAEIWIGMLTENAVSHEDKKRLLALCKNSH